MDPWLKDLRHDLIKHALWRARDLRELAPGSPPTAADVTALRRGLLDLRDGEGNPVTALGLWRTLRAEAEAAGHPAAPLDAFEQAVAAAELAAAALPSPAPPAGAPPAPPVAAPPAPPAPLAAAVEHAIDRILHLEDAFADLARALNQPVER